MKITSKGTLALAVILLFTAGLALSKTNIKSVGVTLTAVTVMPDGTQLQPGTYRMELLSDSSSAQVAFYKNDKLVCKCPVKLESAMEKVPANRMLFEVGNGTHVLRTLEIPGWSQMLVFGGPRT
jgi:hypothetical protein